MMKKSEWQAVLDELASEDREKLGPPPTVEEMLAFERGALPEAEMERVRRLLVAYPDLARALVQPVSAPDEGLLAEEEMERRWAELQVLIHDAPERRGARFWQTFGALAAGIAIVLGGFLWQAQHELRRPRVIATEELLMPDGRRGAGESSLTLAARGEWSLLAIPVIGAGNYDDYRLEILSPSSTTAAWRSNALPRRNNDSFSIIVPNAFLSAPGRYQVVLYGVRGGGEERLATYSFRVPSR